ncbi:MAG: protein rep [Kiritimatiellae bacterium]|nr:protein rep [Kiritimatiellia bacterium]
MISTRRRKWINLKNRYADVFEKHYDEKTAAKLRDCTETLSLVICRDCNHKWYVVNHCRLRACPICSFQVSRERARYLNALCQRIPSVKLLTLTMPAWRGNPKEGIKLLRDSFNKLRKHKLMKSVSGGAYCIEVNPRDDFWHIHLHAILDCKFLPYQRIFSEWRALFDVRHIEVDIRQADSREARSYIAKEVGKNMAISLDPDSIVAWYNAIKGSRLWTSFGTFYNVTLNELEDEKEDSEFLPTCPHCGKTKTMFFARDGPFVCGGEFWAQYEKILTDNWPDKIPADLTYVENL